MTNTKQRALFAAALAALTLVVYARVGGFEFLRFDDPDYVYENGAVSGGLSPASIKWAFASFHSSNWHPLTWLSHMLDCQLFGLDAGKHHLVNAVLHAINAVLCFFLFVTTTRRFWASAFVAAAFALHPMRVQSVAWISERKDVLSTLFFLSALLLYVRYARRPGAGRYATVLIAFACALLSKPSVVTFPIVALLLDRWPLARTEPVKRLILEKLPFVVLAGISTFVTVVAQTESGALSSLLEIPLDARIANAFVAYGFYATHGLVPVELAYFYPHPAIVEPTWNAWNAMTLAAILGFTAVTVLALRTRRPALQVGWLWFVVTLLPMIGIVQVGEQAYADRYAYIPLIGLTIVAAFGLAPARSGGERLGTRRARVATALSSSMIVLWTGLTIHELPYWHDSGRLCARALETTDANYMAEAGLANVLRDEGRIEEARQLYIAAIDHRPDFSEAVYSLGLLEHESGNAELAVALYRRALRTSPGLAEAHLNLGAVLGRTGDIRNAIEEFAAVLALTPLGSPSNASALANLEGMAAEIDGQLRKQVRREGLNDWFDRIQEILERARRDGGVAP